MSIFQKYKEVFIAAGVVSGGALLYFLLKRTRGIGSLASELEDTLGIYEVGGDNVSFSDPKFQQELKDLGWRTGWSWCVLYSKYIWSKILPKKKWDVAKNLLSVNSQTSWVAFSKDKSGYFELSNKPKKGSIVIWQYPNNPSAGHAGVVTKVYEKTFDTQEGNYSGKVSKATRKLIFNNVVETEGFKLLGFINIK